MSLHINTIIPYGNAGDIRISDEGGMPLIRFAPHPHGGPESLWFCFQIAVTSPPASPQVKLVLDNVQNTLGGYAPQTFRPVVKYAGGDWQRLAAPVVHEHPDGRSQAAWIIDAPVSTVDIALCYPYGVPDVDTLLQDTGDYWHADTIGLSQAGRPLVRLSNRYGKTGSTRPGLYLTARQHAGEASGSWVLDGVLRRFAEIGDDAPLVWAVPLTNIDGVEQGDYGKDNFPIDLNRAWGCPPMRHETQVMQQDIQRWKARCAPLFGMDFHAPGASENDGAYFFLPVARKYNPELEAPAVSTIESLAQAIQPEYAAAQYFRRSDYPSRWELPNFSQYCAVEGGFVGFSMETPYFSAGDRVLTREDYRTIGQRLADAMMRMLPDTVSGS